MTRKATSILISLFLLVISIILLLIFFEFGNKSAEFDKSIFSLSSKNIEMNVGDEKRNYYSLTHREADLEIITTDNNIIYADNEKLIGLKPGIANLQLKATLNSTVLTTSIIIKVYNTDYTLELEPVYGATYKAPHLQLNEDCCQFNLRLYNKLYQPVKDALFNINVLGEGLLDNQFGSYVVVCKNECLLEIITSTDMLFQIKVKKT